MGKKKVDADELLYSLWLDLGGLQDRMSVMMDVVREMKRTVERVDAMVKEVKNGAGRNSNVDSRRADAGGAACRAAAGVEGAWPGENGENRAKRSGGEAALQGVAGAGHAGV